ncbi:dihydrodipicolinate synthase family protein [Micromonospora sp. CPCC 205371]|nr:dihydrodipicolinate synthase family protein [Micromonospora sp. CPCC 205371]
MTFSGVYVPMITPFDTAGAVAFGALESLAHEVLDGGAAGLVALGTTGEPASLTESERHGVVDVLARVCTDRSVPLVVGASTAEALRELGDRPAVAAALCLVPPFVRPGEAGVVAQFTALAAASPVPLLAYHVPYRTGQPLSADTLRRLAAIDGVAGVKYSAGGVDATAIDLLADRPDGFAVLGGDDPFISPLLALGADGGILASAHVATAEFAALVEAWHTGTARALGHRLATLSTALFAEPNPTVIKAVLHAQGRIPTADVRLPLLPASPEAARSALRCLQGEPDDRLGLGRLLVNAE